MWWIWTLLLKVWSPVCSFSITCNLLHILAFRPSPRHTARRLWVGPSHILASPPCGSGAWSSLRTIALEFLVRKVHFVLKEYLYDSQRGLVLSSITCCLPTEMGRRVSPKFHAFQLLLSFAIHLSCSGRLACPHQPAPPQLPLAIPGWTWAAQWCSRVSFWNCRRSMAGFCSAIPRTREQISV